MAATLQLLTFPNNFRATKALVAARYAGVDVDVPESFVYGTDNLKPEFLALSPTGKVPVLLTPQGPINQPSAILRYVARLRADSGLYGNNFFESSQVDQWVAFSDNDLEPARNLWLLPIDGAIVFDGRAYDEAKKLLSAALTTLDTFLLANTFLVGNQVTIADIAVACTLMDLWTRVLVVPFTKRWGNVTRWFNTVVNQPNFVAVAGEIKQAQKEQQAPRPKKEEKPKEEKPKEKPAEKPKEDKPKPAAAPAADDLEAMAEAEAAAAKKKKNPLDDLEPSPMILDVVKKSYWSKKPYNKEFWGNFWTEVFDAKGWSFWTATYKHNDENTVEFRTGNLVGGWIQRLDNLRKWGMGVVVICVAEEGKGPYNVSSCWMFRGQEVPAEMVECDDYALQTWVKQDPSNEANRATVQEFFRASDNDSKVGGQICLDCRYFK